MLQWLFQLCRIFQIFSANRSLLHHSVYCHFYFVYWSLWLSILLSFPLVLFDLTSSPEHKICSLFSLIHQLFSLFYPLKFSRSKLLFAFSSDYILWVFSESSSWSLPPNHYQLSRNRITSSEAVCVIVDIFDGFIHIARSHSLKYSLNIFSLNWKFLSIQWLCTSVHFASAIAIKLIYFFITYTLHIYELYCKIYVMMFIFHNISYAFIIILL